jgi:hypothetical protein
MTIAVCCSANFYAQANQIADKLNDSGHKVFLPSTAEIMRKNGDYDVSHYKTWFDNEKDYSKKASLMRAHFDKIEASDAILVINYEKHGEANYIGGNVLMEMALAFHLNNK